MQIFIIITIKGALLFNSDAGSYDKIDGCVPSAIMRELFTAPHYDCDKTDDSLNYSAGSLNDSAKFSEKSRLWALTYVCIVAVQAVIISGFALGFTSPVLSKLKDIRGGNKSLEKTTYQDAFNVCAYI